MASNYNTLQDAIDACEANGGGMVIADAQPYYENITIGSPYVQLMGHHNATVIDGGANGPAIEITASDVTVRDLRVASQGDDSNLTGHNAIYVHTESGLLQDITIENVSVDDAGMNAIVISSADNLRLKRITVNDCDNCGICVQGSTDIDIDDVIVEYSNNSAVYVDSDSSRITIRSVKHVASSGAALTWPIAIDGDYVIVEHCVIRTVCSGYSVVLHGSSNRCLIHGNSLAGNILNWGAANNLRTDNNIGN
jgi:nitrous oxidase accessory protein NosD